MPLCPASKIECRLSVADLDGTVSHELNLHMSKNRAADIDRITSNLSSGQLLSEHPISDLPACTHSGYQERRMHILEVWHNAQDGDAVCIDSQQERIASNNDMSGQFVSSKQQSSISTDAQDDKAFIVSLAIPKDAFYNPHMGSRRFSDLKVEVYLNGELVNATLLSALNRDRLTSKTAGKLLFAGRRVHRQVEKPWVYRRANAHDQYLGGSSRWTQIQDALAMRVYEKGEKDGQQPISASFLQTVASMALPTALIGCAGHLAVLDIVVVGGNGMKYGNSTTYLKRPTMLRDPDFIPQTPSRKAPGSMTPETPSHLLTVHCSPQQASPMTSLPASLLGSLLFSDTATDVSEAMSASFTIDTSAGLDWSSDSTHPQPSSQTYRYDAGGTPIDHNLETNTHGAIDPQLAQIGAWMPSAASTDQALLSSAASQDDMLAGLAVGSANRASWQPVGSPMDFFSRKNSMSLATPTKVRAIAPAPQRYTPVSPRSLGPTSRVWTVPPLNDIEGSALALDNVHTSLKTATDNNGKTAVGPASTLEKASPDKTTHSPVTSRDRRHKPVTSPSTPGEFRYRLRAEQSVQDTVRSFTVPDLARDSVITYAEPGIQRQIEKVRGGEFKEEFFVCGMRFIVR